jgi:hypothetical protein
MKLKLVQGSLLCRDFSQLRWTQLAGKSASGKSGNFLTNSNLILNTCYLHITVNPGRDSGWPSRIRVSYAVRHQR